MSMVGVRHQMSALAARVAVRRGEASSKAPSDETPDTRHATANAGQALLEQVLARENMRRAWKRVKANKGAAGVYGMDIAQKGRYLVTALPPIREQWMASPYRPNPVRRVGILTK
jgi:RNA-directed DNA polymerase